MPYAQASYRPGEWCYRVTMKYTVNHRLGSLQFLFLLLNALVLNKLDLVKGSQRFLGWCLDLWVIEVVLDDCWWLQSGFPVVELSPSLQLFRVLCALEVIAGGSSGTFRVRH
jgi:hypothetical protein